MCAKPQRSATLAMFVAIARQQFGARALHAQVTQVVHGADVQEFLEARVQAAHADARNAGKLLGADGLVRVSL